jgi:hypothetical protein
LNSYSSFDHTDDTGSIYFPNAPAGTYTALISSLDDHFGLLKGVTAPGEYTFDTTGTQHLTVVTKKKDGSPLPGYIWFAEPTTKDVLALGYSSGSLSVDVTPGTYTVMINALSDFYLLALPNVSVNSNTTQVTLDASTMPTGTITFNRYGFDNGFVDAWGSYCYWAYGFRISSGTVITYSTDTYDMEFYGWFNAQDGSNWDYSFKLTDAPVTISDGSTQTIDVGGTLSITAQPEKTSYYLGEQIN